MFVLIIVACGLLNRLVRGLAHCVHQRDSIPSSLGHEPGPEPMGTKFRRIEPKRQRFFRMRLID
jgi:hypothetical protein